MHLSFSNGQQTKAARMIDRALSMGLCISVSDGENGWFVKCSSDRRDILAALGEMDMDELIFRDANNRKEKKGWMMLVWGNAEDGSELPADYTDNETMEQIANA